MDKIKEQAIAAYPKEAVWYVTEDGVYQVGNIHEDPENFFKVSGKDTLIAKQAGLRAVIHSHCDRPHVPSEMDMRCQIMMGIPWGILQTDGENASDILWWGEEEVPELEGRPFIHGISDCFSLIRDYYRLKYSHDIGDVPRNWQWWEEGVDLMGSLYDTMGFSQKVSFEKAKEGDVILIGIGTDIPYHCAIYLGDGTMLHHPGSQHPIDRSKLSVVEPVHRYIPHIKSIRRLNVDNTTS